MSTTSMVAYPSTNTPVQHAASYRGILQGLDLTPDQREFCDRMLRQFPHMLNSFTKVDGIVIRFLESESETPASESRAMITQLVADGILYRRNGKVSFSPFQPKTKTTRAGQYGICCYCGTRTKLTKDHAIPRSAGGPDEPSNVVLCCLNCNLAKGNRTPQEWARDVLSYRKPKKPMTRMPLAYRVPLAVVEIFALLIGGVK